MNAPVVTFKVAKQFHELRRRYLGVRIGIAIAIVVTALISMWMVLAACDYAWEWSLTWRQAALLIGSAAILVGFTQRVYSIARESRQRKFAAQLEHSFEGFGQRIRTVLDTVDGRVSGPDEMLAALGHQTLGRWETLTPALLIPRRALVACGIICLLTTVVAATMFASGGDVRTSMRRALGQEIPYTELAVTPGDARLLEGAAVEVSLLLSGRTHRDVTLRYRQLNVAEGVPEETSDQSDTPAEMQWIESGLLPAEPEDGEKADGRRAKFVAGLGKATDPIEYQFVTSVGTTRVYRLDVQQLIEAERIETRVEAPAYTRLEERAFASATVTVLQHSNVTVSIQTNHPLHQAQLEIGEKPSKLEPVEMLAGQDPAQWTFELPSSDSLHWRFTGAGSDGTPMTPVKGRLRVRYDAAPNLRWRDPPDETRVHTLAELPMRVQVSDDYGINETGIVFQLGGDDEYVLTDWVEEDPESAPNLTTRLQLEQILPLESFALSERDYISYYAYAVDNRGSGPRRSESDVRYIDIRPLRQFYAEIEQDPNNGGAGRVLVQLDEIIRRERFLINRTRRLLRSSSVDLATQLGTIDRMVESQSELAGLTRFLAEFFVSRGNDDVDALNQAEAAMLQAADSLAAGSFDLALAQEEDALRALAEARRSLEVALLKNPTPQQQQALRRLARQLRQKLRRERPETEQKIADNLNRIAAEQSQIGQLAARITREQNTSAGSGQSGDKTEQGGDKTEQGGDKTEQGGDKTEQGGDKTTPENQRRSGSSATANEDETQPDEASDTEPGDTESNTDDSGDEPSADDGEEKADIAAGNADTTQQDDAEQRGGAESDADDNDADSGSEAQQPTLAEQQDQLFARQVDLLERIQAIEEQLRDRLADAPLLAERIEEAQTAMDTLATRARNGDISRIAAGSQNLSDLLRETSMQLDALAASEPVSRVSAIRDMTTSLANMERKLSEQLRPGAKTGSSSTGSGTPSNQIDGAPEARLAQRLQRRSATIEDVLRAPVEVGDVETSEVNDYLERFVEESGFMERLAATRDAAEQIAADEPGEPETNQDEPAAGSGREGDKSEEAFERAVDYAEAARILDELYRQLVTPRLARLREIEQQANQLAQQLGGNGKQADSDDPENQSGIRELQEELKEQGLDELAALLSDPESLDEERQAELREMFGGNGDSDIGLDFQDGNYSARILLVASELQSRIQEMVLREISADRDAPVPAQYRGAVDRYFRAIAGEAEATEATNISATKVGAGGGL